MTAFPRRRMAFSRSNWFLACALFALGVSTLFPPHLFRTARGQGAAAPEKRAVLIGINEYSHPKCAKLDYAENDANEMAAVLRKQGYTVDVLLGAKAKKAAVEAALQKVTRGCEKGDTVLVGLAGHGLQFLGQKDCFFVPFDGVPFADETASLVSLNTVYTHFEKSFAGIKVLLVDACREDPKSSRGIDADTAPRPPQGVAALFSCKAGERAWEHKDYRHGIFFHHVIKAFNGEAEEAVSKSGSVTFARLQAYVAEQVAEDVPRLISGAKQSPTIKADHSGDPVLAKIDLRPVPALGKFAGGKTAGEEWVFTDLKIKMNWCPPTGSKAFTMGSPKSEEGRDTDEDQVDVTLSRGFWLGQTEVTQGLWESVMGTTPWKGEGYVKDGANYPATFVSHEDAVEFSKKLTDREQKAGRLVPGMVYRLPTEAEWEYGCRAGTQMMYSFGADATKLSDYVWWGGIIGGGNAKAERTRTKWERNALTRGVCTICTGTCGSGAAIGMTGSWRAVAIPAALPWARTGCSGAAAGSSPPGSSGRRTATGTCRRTGATPWASDWR